MTAGYPPAPPRGHRRREAIGPVPERGSQPRDGGAITDHVSRPRLVEFASTGHLAVVEAQAGAGKSTLLAELASHHDGPVVRATLSETGAGRPQLRRRLRASLQHRGLTDLLSALDHATDLDPLTALLPGLEERNERLLVLLDDLHLADDDLIRLLGQLLPAWPAPHRLVLAGRRIPEPLRGQVVAQGGSILGPEDLRFRPQETAALLGDEVASHLDDTEIRLLTERSQGWAAALALTVPQLRRASERSGTERNRVIAQVLSAPASLTELIASLLGGMDPDARDAVAQLAALPRFDDELASLAGLRGGVAVLADLGLPLQSAGDGLWSLPNAVRDALRAARIDPDLVRRAAEVYLAHDQPGEALELLRELGDTHQLASLLSTLPPTTLSHLDVSDHAAAIAALEPSTLTEHPRILIDLADAYIVSGRLEEYRETLERAARIVHELPAERQDHPQVLEVRAAQLTARAVAREDDGLVPDAEELLAHPSLPTLARARLLGGVGRAIATRRSAAALRAGMRRFEEAASLYDREGATTHAIATRVVAATYTAWPLGRYDAALALLDRALADGRDSLRVRVSALPYRAFVLIDLGRYAEAEATLAELRRTASATGPVGNERSAAFARWGMAKLASQRGNAEEALAACRAVERSEVVVDAGHGGGFRADAAQLLARVGAFEEAERFLGEARQRDPGTTPAVPLAGFAVAAYRGDLPGAESLLAELADTTVEPRERWRVSLLHAAACHRHGDDRAQVLAATAFEEAAQLGFPDLPRIREAALAEILLPLAETGSASARGSVASRSAARIQLFGRFELTLEGRTQEPTGRPGELLAYLAIQDRQVTTERAIEALWPGTEPSRGRERLRTVLRRTRRDLGEVIERHGDVLRLREGIESDLDRFRELTAPGHGAERDPVDAATTALQLVQGELAPSLGYHSWLEETRTHLDRQMLRLHDLLAARAEEDGRLDDAIRALLDAIPRDPLAEDRYVTAARLLAEQGRRSRGLTLLTEARAALTGAGMTPSDELVRLEAYLRRDPLIAVEAS